MTETKRGVCGAGVKGQVARGVQEELALLSSQLMLLLLLLMLILMLIPLLPIPPRQCDGEYASDLSDPRDCRQWWRDVLPHRPQAQAEGLTPLRSQREGSPGCCPAKGWRGDGPPTGDANCHCYLLAANGALRP